MNSEKVDELELPEKMVSTTSEIENVWIYVGLRGTIPKISEFTVSAIVVDVTSIFRLFEFFGLNTFVDPDDTLLDFPNASYMTIFQVWSAQMKPLYPW